MNYVRLSLLATITLGFMSGCAHLSTVDSPSTNKDKDDSSVNVSFLLSMDFNEAAAISGQQAVIPPYVKVAADEIQVLKKDSSGRVRKVRAKGHVFVQLDYSSQARALCQEALISDEDIILRGHPLLQRGQSTVEGVADVTVLYMFGTRLRAIGPHKVSNTSELVRNAPLLSAWQDGEASLLPPLESSDVPEAVREELRKATEAEAALQRSRDGQPMAFPEALDSSKPTQSN